MGADGVAAGTTVAEDCPVPASAGSCDVGGAQVDVTTLATGTAFVSTIGGALNKGTPKLTNVDRVSCVRAGATPFPIGRRIDRMTRYQAIRPRPRRLRS